MTQWPTQFDARRIDGDPYHVGWEAHNIVEVPCPWPLTYEGQPYNHGVKINIKVRDSLVLVFNNVWEKAGKNLDVIRAAHADRFSGGFVLRAMRQNPHALSMHALGRALDFDDANNQQGHQHHFFTPDNILIAEFIAQGWRWGGYWNLPSTDAMHVQAAIV
jgi:hypothetical protein